MSDIDFTVYVSPKNSKDIYKDNTIQSFTNNINPPIILDTSFNWEIGLTSCLLGFEQLPFNTHINKSFRITIYTEYVIHIEENSEIKRDSNAVTINLPSHLFFNKKPEKIYQQIIEFTRSKWSKSTEFVQNFLGIHDGHIVLTLRTSKSIIKNGALKNLTLITMKLNKHMQKLLGLNESEYTLFKRDPNSSGIPQTIIGDKEIQIEQKEPSYIMIYTDIIQPSRFGNQFINILDIVPFGSSVSIDRKLNKITYKNLNKNIINDISIVIQDPTFNLMENESEDCVLALHFRRKKTFI